MSKHWSGNDFLSMTFEEWCNTKGFEPTSVVAFSQWRNAVNEELKKVCY